MIEIYTRKTEGETQDIQKYNDSFFNINIYGTTFNEEEKRFIMIIDHAEVIDEIQIMTPFGIGSVMDLSTGCKTYLNILRFPEYLFCVDGCGPDVLQLIFQEQRNIRVFMTFNQFFRMKEPFDVKIDGQYIVHTNSEYQKYWETVSIK